MKTGILTILAFSFSLIGYSQLDNIYLHPDYVIYKGDTLSRYDNNGLKQGKWIEYEIYNILYVLAPRTCDSITIDGSIILNEDYVAEYYLRTKDKNDSNCDSAFSNVIPPIIIETLSYGYYINDKKSGKWKTYDKNEKLYKEFYFKNGIPVDSFFIYYTNGKYKAKGKINTNGNNFIFEKFSETGILLETKTYKIEEIQKLL